ncbi:hypothetical protein B6D60_11205 [candidate division KSB1 bacterium 4484_87]|nr:MAG: hypothetical protein B6D60_11205 [candidate division KSB1 bacterium 4484_87]
MDQKYLLQAFEDLVQKLSIDLRYEKGDFSGGLCQMPNKTVLIINSKLPLEQKIRLIARELSHLKLNHIYIRPALRELIAEANRGN